MGGCAARHTTVVAQEPAHYGGQLNTAASATPATRTAGSTKTTRTASSNPGARSLAPATYAPTRLQRVPENVDDDAAIGANTYLYLNRRIPKLIVEIDAVAGYEPAPSALRLLRTRLGQVVDKPGGIDFLPVKTIPHTEDGDANNSFMENTEKRYRTHHSSASAIVLYVLYTDGDTGGVIGAAYSSSAYAVFKQAIASAATPLVTAEEIEDSVIVHEAGHVLALVDIGYQSPRNHEDPQHPGHSKNPRSVMYWAVDNVGVVGLLGGSTRPPTAFDSDDIADLRDLRDGKLK